LLALKFRAILADKGKDSNGRNSMKLNIDFTRRTAYADVRERDSLSILCTSREDGLKHFADHYPAAQGYKIEKSEEA
jgi:hypothetical protein